MANIITVLVEHDNINYYKDKMIGFWCSIAGILVVFGAGALLFYLVLLIILILRVHRR